MKLIALVVIILFSHFSSSAPAVETHVTSNALTFLEKFGYLTPPDPRSGNLMSEDVISSSIRQLQRFGGIPETGVMDNETETLIKTPRCGMSDFGPTDNAKRKRRYAHQGSKWKKEHLTWRYSSRNRNNDGLSDVRVRRVLSKSLKKWSDVTYLDFKEITTGTPDIWFRFVYGYHRDSYPFDGRGRTLAHAFYPMDNTGLAGDVHFDDDETYTIGVGYGKSLLWVAVHELGHSIGLEHSNKRGAIMYPWYQSHHKGKDFDLTEDDIIGIQSLYGGRSRNKNRTPLPVLGSLPPEVTVKPLPSRGCTDHIKAVFLGKDKKTYVINKNKLYVLGTNLGIDKGPIPVENYFKGITSVDAAFTRHGDERTIFFSKDEFYVFDDKKMVSGARKITEGFSGVPDGFSNINAAFIWPRNNRLYIFHGKHYYRFSQKRNSIRKDYVMDYGYPRLISVAWINVPHDVDAVFTWRNEKSYFFKGSKYYRLNNQLIEVDNGYPKSIAREWMYCSPSRLVDIDSSSHVLRVTIATIFASIAALIKLL